MSFDFTSHLRANLPAPVPAPFSGYPEFYFVGGNNDADSLPLTKLGDIATVSYTHLTLPTNREV